MKKIVLFTIALLLNLALFAQDSLKNTSKNIGPIKTTVGDSMLKTNDVVQNMAISRDLSVFYSFIIKANLAETYESKGPITVFAPVNSAFDTLASGKLDSMSKQSHALELTHIISYHAVAGSLTAKDIEKQIDNGKGTATLTTLSGAKLTARVDANRNIVLTDETGGQSIVSRFDIKQSNGIVHVVNKLLMPKAKVI